MRFSANLSPDAQAFSADSISLAFPEDSRALPDDSWAFADDVASLAILKSPSLAEFARGIHPLDFRQPVVTRSQRPRMPEDFLFFPAHPQPPVGVIPHIAAADTRH
jgi:hypothetical protein